MTARGGHVGPSRHERVPVLAAACSPPGDGGAAAQGGGPRGGSSSGGRSCVAAWLPSPLGGWGSRVLPVPSFSICCSIQCPGRGQPPPHLPVSQESPVPSVDPAGVLGMSSGSPAPLGHGRGLCRDRATSHPDSLLCPWGAGCSGQCQSPLFPCCRSSMRPWVR